MEYGSNNNFFNDFKPQPRLDESDRLIVVRINNKTGQYKEVMLFNQYLPFNHKKEKVSVEVETGNYKKVMSHLATKTIEVMGMKYYSDFLKPEKFSPNKIIFRDEKYWGQCSEAYINPEDYRRATDLVYNIIEIPREFQLNADSSVIARVNPGYTTLVFFCKNMNPEMMYLKKSNILTKIKWFFKSFYWKNL